MKASEFITEAKAVKQRLDPKCWSGKKIGNPKTKVKGGVRVNNCVPAESVQESEQRCAQCGMTNCTCAPGACKCKPVSGWVPGKGFKKAMDEAANAAQQAAIAIAMKKAGKKPKSESREMCSVCGQTPCNCTHLAEEFDLIESIISRLAEHNQVDAEVIWEDLESLTDDELYVFAVTSEPIMEDWQKVNKKDKTDGMSQKAVNAYRREHPGSKLKTAVTTKPSKLKKGSKASKRRKSYCSRSRGQMKMHNISCAKTPDKAICKARRRWNC